MPTSLRFYSAHTGQMLEVLANDAEAPGLLTQYTQEGWVLLTQREVSDPGRSRGARALFAARNDTLDSAWWCRELRGLLLAGMTVVEAIDTLKAQPLGAARDRVHHQLVERLQQGQALSVAMKSTGAFPAVLVASVKASERTSTLVSALDDYLRYHELLDHLKKKVISAAIYPSIVLGLGVLIVVFLLMFVIPRFATMYAGAVTQPGMVTRTMLWLSQTLNQHSGVVVALLAMLGVATIYSFQHGLLGRWGAAAIERIPPLHRQVHEFRLAKLYQSLALMVRGGYAIAESLEQCAALELGPTMSQRLLQARADLEQGKSVSKALSRAGLTDTVTVRLLMIAERTGNFDQVLQTVSQRHAATFITFIERMTRVVEPLMLLTASLMVGAVVVMMYMPVFDIAGSIR